MLNGAETSRPERSELALFIETLDFAARKHATERRKDPELTDILVLQAALLHDTVEDTARSEQELRDRFGADVADVVIECPDDKTLPSSDRKLAQIAHAGSVSHRAKLVKLADKLYNLRDLQRVQLVGWSEERRRQYFVWAGRVLEGLRGADADAEMERQIDLVTQDYLASISV